jgi:hypothetical protein
MIDTIIETQREVLVVEANDQHYKYAAQICDMIETAAKIRGTGIAKRDASYIEQKMKENKAIIALNEEKVVGFLLC